MIKTANSPLTYDHLLKARKALNADENNIVRNVLLTGEVSFKKLKIRARFYSGKQLVRRNRNSNSKKNRYILTELVPIMKMLDDNIITHSGIKIIKDVCLQSNYAVQL